MKLHFEPDPDFQHEAIEAACDLLLVALSSLHSPARRQGLLRPG